jgi:hypothetical protein
MAKTEFEILDEYTHVPDIQLLDTRDPRINMDQKDPQGLILSDQSDPNVYLGTSPMAAGYVTNRDSGKPILHLTAVGSKFALVPVEYKQGTYHVYVASGDQAWGYYRLNLFLSDNMEPDSEQVEVIKEIPLVSGKTISCRYLGSISTIGYLVGSRYDYTSYIDSDRTNGKLACSRNRIYYIGEEGEQVEVGEDSIPYEYLFCRFGYPLLNLPLVPSVKDFFGVSPASSGTCNVFIASGQPEWEEVWPGLSGHLILMTSSTGSGNPFPINLRDGRTLDAFYVGKVTIDVDTNHSYPNTGLYIYGLTIIEGEPYLQSRMIGDEYVLFYANEDVPSRLIGGEQVQCRYIPLHFNSHLFRPVITLDKTIQLRSEYRTLTSGIYNLSLVEVIDPEAIPLVGRKCLQATDFETDPTHALVTDKFLGIASITLTDGNEYIMETEIADGSDVNLTVNANNEPQYTEGTDKYTLQLHKWVYRDLVVVENDNESFKNPLKMVKRKSIGFKYPVKRLARMSPSGSWRPPIQKNLANGTLEKLTFATTQYPVYRVWMALDDPTWEHFDPVYRGQIFLMPYEGTPDTVDPPREFPYDSVYGILRAYYMGKITYSMEANQGYWGPHLKEDPDPWEDDFFYEQDEYVLRVTTVYQCLQTHRSTVFDRPNDGAGAWEDFWAEVPYNSYQSPPGGPGGSPGPDGWVDLWGSERVSIESPAISKDIFNVDVHLKNNRITSFTQGGQTTLVNPVVGDAICRDTSLNLRVFPGVVLDLDLPVTENSAYCELDGSKMRIKQAGYYEIYYSLYADRPFTGTVGLRLNGEPDPPGGLPSLHFPVSGYLEKYELKVPPNVVYLEPGDYYEIYAVCTNPLELTDVAFLLKAEVKILRFTEYPLSLKLYEAVDKVNEFLKWKGQVAGTPFIEPKTINDWLYKFSGLKDSRTWDNNPVMTATQVSPTEWDIHVTLRTTSLILQGMALHCRDRRLFPGPRYYDLVSDKRIFEQGSITFNVYAPVGYHYKEIEGGVFDIRILTQMNFTETIAAKYCGRPGGRYELDLGYVGNQYILESVSIDGPPFMIRPADDPGAMTFKEYRSGIPVQYGESNWRRHFQIVDEERVIKGDFLGTISYALDRDGILLGSITNNLTELFHDFLTGIVLGGLALAPGYMHPSMFSLTASETVQYKVFKASTSGAFGYTELTRYSGKAFLVKHRDDLTGEVLQNYFPLQHYATNNLFTATYYGVVEITTNSLGRAISCDIIETAQSFSVSGTPGLDLTLTAGGSSILLNRDERTLTVPQDSYQSYSDSSYPVWISADQQEWENLSVDHRGKMFLTRASDGLVFDPHTPDTGEHYYAYYLGAMSYTINSFFDEEEQRYRYYPTEGVIIDRVDAGMDYYGGGSNPAYVNSQNPYKFIGPYRTKVANLDLISSRRFYTNVKKTIRYYKNTLLGVSLFDRGQRELWDIWVTPSLYGWEQAESYYNLSSSGGLFLTRASENFSFPISVDSENSVDAIKLGQAWIKFSRIQDTINYAMPTYQISEIEILEPYTKGLATHPVTNELYFSDPDLGIMEIGGSVIDVSYLTLNVPKTYQLPPIISYRGDTLSLSLPAEPKSGTYNVYLTGNEPEWEDQVLIGSQNSLILSSIEPDPGTDVITATVIGSRISSIPAVKLDNDLTYSKITGNSFRLWVTPSQDCDQIRFKFKSLNTSEPLVITRAYFGMANQGVLDEYDDIGPHFVNPPSKVPVTFNNGQPYLNLPPLSTIWSDWVSFSMTKGVRYIISWGGPTAGNTVVLNDSYKKNQLGAADYTYGFDYIYDLCDVSQIEVTPSSGVVDVREQVIISREAYGDICIKAFKTASNSATKIRFRFSTNITDVQSVRIKSAKFGLQSNIAFVFDPSLDPIPLTFAGYPSIDIDTYMQEFWSDWIDFDFSEQPPDSIYLLWWDGSLNNNFGSDLEIAYGREALDAEEDYSWNLVSSTTALDVSQIETSLDGEVTNNFARPVTGTGQAAATRRRVLYFDGSFSRVRFKVSAPPDIVSLICISEVYFGKQDSLASDPYCFASSPQKQPVTFNSSQRLIFLSDQDTEIWSDWINFDISSGNYVLSWDESSGDAYTNVETASVGSGYKSVSSSNSHMEEPPTDFTSLGIDWSAPLSSVEVDYDGSGIKRLHTFPITTGEGASERKKYHVRFVITDKYMGNGHIRLKLVNPEDATDDLTIQAMTVGITNGNLSTIFAGSIIPVTFNSGSAGVTLSPGESLWSDWVSITELSSDYGDPYLLIAIDTYEPLHGVATPYVYYTSGSGYANVDVPSFSYGSDTAWMDIIGIDLSSSAGGSGTVETIYQVNNDLSSGFPTYSYNFRAPWVAPRDAMGVRVRFGKDSASPMLLTSCYFGEVAPGTNYHFASTPSKIQLTFSGSSGKQLIGDLRSSWTDWGTFSIQKGKTYMVSYEGGYLGHRSSIAGGVYRYAFKKSGVWGVDSAEFPGGDYDNFYNLPVVGGFEYSDNQDLVGRINVGMYANSSPSPAVVSQSDGSNYAYRVYDDNTTTSNPISGSAPYWTKIDLGSGNARVVTKIRYMIGGSYYAPRDFAIQGSNDNSNWVNLYSTTYFNPSLGNYPEFAVLTFNNTTAYRYYRFYASARWYSYSISFNEFQLFETSSSTLPDRLSTLFISKDIVSRNTEFRIVIRPREAASRIRFLFSCPTSSVTDFSLSQCYFGQLSGSYAFAPDPLKSQVTFSSNEGLQISPGSSVWSDWVDFDISEDIEYLLAFDGSAVDFGFSSDFLTTFFESNSNQASEDVPRLSESSYTYSTFSEVEAFDGTDTASCHYDTLTASSASACHVRQVVSFVKDSDRVRFKFSLPCGSTKGYAIINQAYFGQRNYNYVFYTGKLPLTFSGGSQYVLDASVGKTEVWTDWLDYSVNTSYDYLISWDGYGLLNKDDVGEAYRNSSGNTTKKLDVSEIQVEESSQARTVFRANIVNSEFNSSEPVLIRRALNMYSSFSRIRFQFSVPPGSIVPANIYNCFFGVAEYSWSHNFTSTPGLVRRVTFSGQSSVVIDPRTTTTVWSDWISYAFPGPDTGWAYKTYLLSWDGYGIGNFCPEPRVFYFGSAANAATDEPSESFDTYTYGDVVSIESKKGGSVVTEFSRQIYTPSTNKTISCVQNIFTREEFKVVRFKFTIPPLAQEPLLISEVWVGEWGAFNTPPIEDPVVAQITFNEGQDTSLFLDLGSESVWSDWVTIPTEEAMSRLQLYTEGLSIGNRGSKEATYYKGGASEAHLDSVSGYGLYSPSASADITRIEVKDILEEEESTLTSADSINGWDSVSGTFRRFVDFTTSGNYIRFRFSRPYQDQDFSLNQAHFGYRDQDTYGFLTSPPKIRVTFGGVSGFTMSGTEIDVWSDWMRYDILQGHKYLLTWDGSAVGYLTAVPSARIGGVNRANIIDITEFDIKGIEYYEREVTSKLVGVVEVQMKEVNLGKSPLINVQRTETANSIVVGSPEDTSLGTLVTSEGVPFCLPQYLTDSVEETQYSSDTFNPLQVVEFDRWNKAAFAKQVDMKDGVYYIYQMADENFFYNITTETSDAGSEYDATNIVGYDGRIFLSQAEPDQYGYIYLTAPEATSFSWWNYPQLCSAFKIGTCKVGESVAASWITSKAELMPEIFIDPTVSQDEDATIGIYPDLDRTVPGGHYSLSDIRDWEIVVRNLTKHRIVLGYVGQLSSLRRQKMEQFGFSFLTLSDVPTHSWTSPVVVEGLSKEFYLVDNFTFYIIFVTEDGDLLLRGPGPKEVSGTCVDSSIKSLRSGVGKFRNPLRLIGGYPEVTKIDPGLAYYLYLAPSDPSWQDFSGQLFLSSESPSLFEGEYVLDSSITLAKALCIGRVSTTKELTLTSNYGNYIFDVFPGSDIQLKVGESSEDLYWEERLPQFEHHCLSDGAAVYSGSSPYNEYGDRVNPLLVGKVLLLFEDKPLALSLPGYETHFPAAERVDAGIYYIYRTVPDVRWMSFSDAAFLSMSPPDKSGEKSWSGFFETTEVRSWCVGKVILRYGPSQSLEQVYPGAAQILEGSDYLRIVSDNSLRYVDEDNWKKTIRATEVVLLGMSWSYSDGNGKPLFFDPLTSQISVVDEFLEGIYNVYVSSMELGWEDLSLDYIGSLFLCQAEPNTVGDILTSYIGSEQVQAWKVGRVQVTYFRASESQPESKFSGFGSTVVSGTNPIATETVVPDSGIRSFFSGGEVYIGAVMLPIYAEGKPIYLELQFILPPDLNNKDCVIQITSWCLDYTIDLDEYFVSGQPPPVIDNASFLLTQEIGLDDLMNSRIKMFKVTDNSGRIGQRQVNLGDSIIAKVVVKSNAVVSNKTLQIVPEPVISSLTFLFHPVESEEQG